MPSIALELTDLTRKRNVSYDDVARVIEKDPLIAVSVLKLAQSPLYATRSPVQSLREALNRLGLHTLRDLVWRVVMDTRPFRASSYTAMVERLQQHATFTAYAARIVAQHAGVAAEQAFLCGLLHDVGWSGALLVISETEKTPRDARQLFATIDKLHTEAGAAMAKLWGLSPEVIAVIGHHHTLDAEQRPVSMLVPVLCVAEHLAGEFGFGVQSRTETDLESCDRLEGNLDRYDHALATLALSPKMDSIREQVEQAAQGIDGGDFAG